MKRVLIIEDDAAYARFLASSLPGCEHHYAATFRQAREKLKALTFDTVLCDLGLPDCSREEAGAWIYALVGEAVFIIVTGSMRDVDGIRYDALAYKGDLRDGVDVRGLVRRAEIGHSGVRPLARKVDALSWLAHFFYKPKTKVA